MRRLTLLAAALLLVGCMPWLGGCALVGAIAALPPVTQATVYGGMAVAGAAVGTLSVNALHDCHQDGGCKALPPPP